MGISLCMGTGLFTVNRSEKDVKVCVCVVLEGTAALPHSLDYNARTTPLALTHTHTHHYPHIVTLKSGA